GEPPPAPRSPAPGAVTFSHAFGQQCQLMEAAVQSLHTLNDQISHFIVTKSKALEEDKDPFLPTEKETLKSSMILMRHLLMDAQESSIRNQTRDFQCICNDSVGF
uniref:Kazrin, periplakin interacting protein n=2 Tax=Canis lupus familiaris TaxID=9615 RepID=A0A8C0NH62_CANLF